MFENLKDPRCFTREVEFVKYVINHTKREYYDRLTKQKSDNGEERRFDPTALLLLAREGYEDAPFGTWIGDDVESSIDEEYVNLLGYDNCTQKYCDPFFFGVVKYNNLSIETVILENYMLN